MHKITFKKNPSNKEINILENGICAEAFDKKGLSKLEEFGFFIKDENKQIIGGLTALYCYQSIDIDALWIHPQYRNLSLGKELMLNAENYAKKRNCKFITICTMDFEAREYYQKLGFVIEFKRDGYEKDSSLYYLKKELT